MEYTKIFETDRVILRKATLSDTNHIFENYASREKVTEFLSWLPHKSSQDTIDYLNNVVLPDYKKQSYMWFIELKDNNQVIGNISVVNMNLEKKMAELGWVLSDDYWGRGIMPEVAKVILDYLKQEGFVRIEARHNVKNSKSGRVMQKIGIKYEGVLRKSSYNNKSELVDIAVYSFINGED